MSLKIKNKKMTSHIFFLMYEEKQKDVRPTKLCHSSVFLLSSKQGEVMYFSTYYPSCISLACKSCKTNTL